MKAPSIPMRVFGHPVVALVVAVGGGLFLYAAYQTGGAGWPLVMAGLVLACTIGEASQRRVIYEAWRREWEGLDDRPKRPSANAVVATIATAIVFVAAFGFGHAGDADSAFLTRVGIGYALFFGPFILWRAARALFRRRPRRVAKAMPVATVAGSVMPVPSLSRARDALPDYCKRLQ